MPCRNIVYVRQIDRLPSGRCLVMEYVIMRYVESLPPLVGPPPASDAPTAVAATPAAHRVGAQQELLTLPRPRARKTPVPAIDRRTTPRAAPELSERRVYCRRIRSLSCLQELRAGADRRRRNQRKNDLTTAIDEKV